MIRWLGFITGGVLILSCFFVWISLPDRDLQVTGISASGTSFGKPGYFNLLLTALYLMMLLPKQSWVRRANVFVAALNLAWVVRNYLALTACFAGECPVVHAAFYLYLAAAIGMMLVVLFAPQKTAITSVANND